MTENRAETTFAGGIRSAQDNIDIMMRIARLLVRQGADSEEIAQSFKNVSYKALSAADEIRKYQPLGSNEIS